MGTSKKFNSNTEKELDAVLLKPTDEIKNYAKGQLADLKDGQTKGYTTVKRLIEKLRSKKNYEAANSLAAILVQYTKAACEGDKTAETLNRYFTAVVNQGAYKAIQEADEEVADFIKGAGLKPNDKRLIQLLTTRLKAANRLKKDYEDFLTVYLSIDESERKRNAYIITQYYRCLNREGMYDDVIGDYEALLGGARKDERVRKLYEYAVSRTQRSAFLIFRDESDSAKRIEEALKSLGVGVILIEGDEADILKKLEKEPSANRFAVVYGDGFSAEARGYFCGKVGQKNMVEIKEKNEGASVFQMSFGLTDQMKS